MVHDAMRAHLPSVASFKLPAVLMGPVAVAIGLWSKAYYSGSISLCRTIHIPPIPHREDIGAYLETSKFTSGIELGVRDGKHSRKYLAGYKINEQLVA